MNYIDVFIIIFAIGALFRGKEIGFVRQLFSTFGFFGGLLLGAFLQPTTVAWVNTPLSELVVTLTTTLGCAMIFLIVGELIGVRIKRKILHGHANLPDTILGVVLGVVTLLIGVWLSAAIFLSAPSPSLQAAIRNSAVISSLNRILPSAPAVVSNLSRLINPNGFPDVFSGREPTPSTVVVLPDLGAMQQAVEQAKASTVKIEGRGCGGIVDGTGFVVGEGLVATNAHVVAGIASPRIIDDNGNRAATPIWFNADLDVAILRVGNLAGQPLELHTKTVPRGTPAVVLGFPGGGPLTADTASVTARFIATGRDIYNQRATIREIYELHVDIEPGNSGGPVIGQDGKIVGMVFAESTAYDNVGYALTAAEVADELASARASNRTVSTGSCAQR